MAPPLPLFLRAASTSPLSQTSPWPLMPGNGRPDTTRISRFVHSSFHFLTLFLPVRIDWSLNYSIPLATVCPLDRNPISKSRWTNSVSTMRYQHLRGGFCFSLKNVFLLNFCGCYQICRMLLWNKSHSNLLLYDYNFIAIFQNSQIAYGT